VLTFAGELTEDELLGHTGESVKTHVDPEISEYKPNAAVRRWVVGIGNGA
jgi:hypothetical protein